MSPENPAIGVVTIGAFAAMRQRLEEALAVARASEACAKEGQPDRALRIVLDVEPLAVDVNHLLQGLALLSRISKPSAEVDDT